ncbi:MAG: M18 family aminopeptidase [Alkalispirochaeta sp.]
MNGTSQVVQFFDTGVSAAHVATEIASRLTESGSRRLDPGDAWRIDPGEAVHLHLDGTVIAYRAAAENETGLVIAAAHTDSPGLHLKHRSAVLRDGMLQIPVEVYGAPILATWTDRELQIVGRIAIDESRQSRGGVRGTETQPAPIRVTLFATRKPTAIIPNLAIHLNREVNENLTYNRQDHLKVLIPIPEDALLHRGDGSAGVDRSDEWNTPNEHEGSAVPARIIAGILDIDPASIVDMELAVVPVESARVIGAGTSALIVSPRVDNLAGCFTVLEGFRAAAGHDSFGQIAIFFDHEEIGSTTAAGAAGDLTRRTIERLLRGRGFDAEGIDRILARSVLVSNDGAHARHPNYSDKHDAGYAPVLGGGPVVKKSAIRRYATELPVAAWFAAACRSVDVPVQYLQNRSDIVAGSTIGPAVASRLVVPSVDVGIPMLSMHSVRETAALIDITATARVFHELFERGYP